MGTSPETCPDSPPTLRRDRRRQEEVLCSKGRDGTGVEGVGTGLVTTTERLVLSLRSSLFAPSVPVLSLWSGDPDLGPGPPFSGSRNPPPTVPPSPVISVEGKTPTRDTIPPSSPRLRGSFLPPSTGPTLRPTLQGVPVKCFTRKCYNRNFIVGILERE